jgi:thioesterase domain-containing protein
MGVTTPFIVLPGASGKAPSLTIFGANPGDEVDFKTINYPGWQRYSAEGFSAEVLIADLVSQIESMVPQGPIRILGISIGGHFGYAAALRLQAGGREISGFCAIDTFMIASAAPRVGWKSRALEHGLSLLRERRMGELGVFVRSRSWRSLLRLAGDRLPSVMQLLKSSGRLASLAQFDHTIEEELSMRLLIREVATWVASLDREPTALLAPAILIRTSESVIDDLGWRRRCPGIKIFVVPGTHHTIFDSENILTLNRTFVTATRDWDAPVEATAVSLISVASKHWSPP